MYKFDGLVDLFQDPQFLNFFATSEVFIVAASLLWGDLIVFHQNI
jgi:hypothetical protein